MNCLLTQVYSSRDKGLHSPRVVQPYPCQPPWHPSRDWQDAAQAKEAVYWPGIDADFIDYVCQCTICTKHKASPTVQPMLPRDIPDNPWQEITTDYLNHKGKEYLLVCNLFSKYPFLYKVSTRSVQSLPMHLLELTSQSRLPCMLHTNNGPPFALDELVQFLQCHGIDHIISSPHFSRSNGFFEQQVHTIKTALSTTQEPHKSQEVFCLTYNQLKWGPTCPLPGRPCTTGPSSSLVSHQHQWSGMCLWLPGIQMPVTEASN